MGMRAPQPSPDAVEMFQVKPSALAKKLSFAWREKPRGSGEVHPGPRPDVGNQAQYGEGSGIPEGVGLTFAFEEAERFRLPDADGLGQRDMWLISEKCRKVFLETDADAFDMAPARTVFNTAKGERDGPSYWLCDVVRFVDAMDESPEFSHPLGDGPIKRVWPNSPTKARFHVAAIGNAKIFRAYHAPGLIYCTAPFKEAVDAQKIKGVYFQTGGWAA